MTCNVGGIERPIRIGLGVVLLGLGVFGDFPTPGMVAALIIGAVALGSGLLGYCPAWSLLGINTCPAKQAGKAP